MTLAEEAQLYLAVVDVFRKEGCEPHWRLEWIEPPVVRPPRARKGRVQPPQTKKRRKLC